MDNSAKTVYHKSRYDTIFSDYKLKDTEEYTCKQRRHKAWSVSGLFLRR